MTVGELIEELQKYPSDYNIRFYADELGGYSSVGKVYKELHMSKTVVLEEENYAE